MARIKDLGKQGWLSVLAVKMICREFDRFVSVYAGVLEESHKGCWLLSASA